MHLCRGFSYGLWELSCFLVICVFLSIFKIQGYRGEVGGCLLGARDVG